MVKIKVFLLSLLMPVVVSAHESPGDVHVSISNGLHGAYTLEGSFSIVASSVAAWEILTDYDHMSAFVSSVKSSRRIRHENGKWLVEQAMRGQAGFFRKHIYLLLEVTEKPSQTIAFRDISRRSFKSYAGTWEIQNQEAGINVLYHLEATPAFFSPDFIAVGAFKKSVRLLLEEVREEIIRRNQWERKGDSQ